MEAEKHSTRGNRDGSTAGDLARQAAWMESRFLRARAYAARTAKPTWRNKGPRGWTRGMNDARVFKVFWVVLPKIPLKPGTILRSGAVVPACGAWLNHLPVSRSFCTRRQALQRLKQLQWKFPDAEVIGLRYWDREYCQMSPCSIEAPKEAPLGWLNVQAAKAAA